MATITFTQWGFGLDLRKGASTSDANRLRVLKNAYITEGKTIRKRPGTTKVKTFAPGTVGLFAGLGKLNTFQTLCTNFPGAVNHGLGIFQNSLLTAPPFTYETDGVSLRNVDNVEPFNGFLYVAAVHYGPQEQGVSYKHHYIDGAPSTFVDDAPPRRGITKVASKIWCADGDTVKYSATNAPRDWTTADNAGFLPVGLQQSGSKRSVTVGNYKNRLVVFFPDSSQVWQVDVDPANNQFLDSIDIGTNLLYAHQNMNSDVFFLSPAGVRTITRQATTESLIDSDVGSPIDYELLRGAFIDTSAARGQYFRGAGQYWLYAGNKAVVFTFSRSSKISAWSIYEFPFTLDYIDELETLLYIRSGDDVYRVDRDVWTDGGAKYEVLIETPFVDFKTPGVDKQVYAIDAVFTGTGDISHRFDPRNPALITSPPITVTGDTQPGNVYPVELITTNLATAVRNFDDQEFEMHSISYQFANLR